MTGRFIGELSRVLSNHNTSAPQNNQTEESVMSVNTSTTTTSEREPESVTQIDVVPATGGIMEMSDEKLDRALEITEKVKRGETVCVRERTPRLEERITAGTFIELGPDPQVMTRDLFLSEDDTEPRDMDDTEVTACGDDDLCDLTPGETQYVQPVTQTDDPNQWLMDAMRTIHNDIQQLKPAISEIPKLKLIADKLLDNQQKMEERINENQIMMAELTSSVIELTNRVKNVEVATARIRVDLAKQFDLSTASTQPSISPRQQVMSATPKSISKTDEKNIDAFISALSTQKTMTAEHETILRNMLMIRDKEIITQTLQELGSIRQIVPAELDKLIMMDLTSSTSMKDGFKIISGLLPTKISGPISCGGVCEKAISPPSVKKPLPNPFRIRK